MNSCPQFGICLGFCAHFNIFVDFLHFPLRQNRPFEKFRRRIVARIASGRKDVVEALHFFKDLGAELRGFFRRGNLAVGIPDGDVEVERVGQSGAFVHHIIFAELHQFVSFPVVGSARHQLDDIGIKVHHILKITVKM